ncbi:11393_t:CDS:2, partial [Funneliformis caledonium]
YHTKVSSFAAFHDTILSCTDFLTLAMTNAFASLPLYPFLIYWNASLFRIFRERASLSIPVPFPRFRPRDCCVKAEQSVMICGDIQPLTSVELEKWLLKANTGLKDIPSSVSNITEDMVLLNTGFQHILMLRITSGSSDQTIFAIRVISSYVSFLKTTIPVEYWKGLRRGLPQKKSITIIRWPVDIKNMV